ncbi:MAG: hypothetical protein JWM21_1782 [Acidobacteria bacterium]|nr:hypothetical protein [Acidobacteriota bacterium]
MTISSSNHWWQNWPKTHAFVAEKVFFPRTAGEIADAIRIAETDHRPLRAVGGGWSFSDAALPGTVNTNRPNVYAVEALSAVIPPATIFPPDQSTASTASIAGSARTADRERSMVMLNFPKDTTPFVDQDWTYSGDGNWKHVNGLYPAATNPDFLHFLAGATWRPIRNPNAACVEESDTAGSLVMFDLAKDLTKPSRDWFYNGNGFWSVGVAGESTPNHGTLYTLAYDQRLKSSDPSRPMNLSPRASQAGESLSLLLSKQPTVPASPEPVYLINTRSMVSSLQQHFPSILSDNAKDITGDQPSNGQPQRFLFHVEGGITIAELGRLLAHQSPRLSLEAISGSPGATLAGALATGTHGAEFNWLLVVDRVKAVHLVGPGGLQWWIEGNESIADPQKIQSAYPDIPLERIISGATAPGGIVGADWLSGAVVSMGSMGVLYSLVLEVVPLFGVHEIVVQTTWRNLRLPGTLGQSDWRWCHKCQGLFFAGGQSVSGSCPAGGSHEKGVSGNYTVVYDSPGTPGQSEWRWCHKCQGLFYSGGQSAAGNCPTGGKHEKGVSGNYTVANDSPQTQGQPDWRFCNKCQGLFFSGGQSSAGSCPGGGQHAKGASGNYTLAHDVAPLLRSPSTSHEVSAKVVELLQRGELNGTGIPQVDAQGNKINQYADLAINPNRKVDGDFDCWIGNREVTPHVPIDSQPAAGNETADMIKGIGMSLSDHLFEKFKNLYGFGSTLDIVGNVITYSGSRAKLSRVTQASDIINVALDTLLTPMVGNPDGGLVGQAFLTGVLSGLLGTANCARVSDKTGVSVGALGFPESGVMGTAMEIALSPADAFGFLQTEILDHADLNMDKNIPFFGYVSIRLCSRTKSLMGMQQFGEEGNPCSVMIEVVGFATPESRKFMQDLQKRTLDRVAAGTLDAMLHWGLENDQLRAHHLRKTKALQKRTQSGMSKLGTFKAARAWLHTAAPNAFRVFDNNFTERLGLSALDGLVFCDDQQKVIATWNPIAMGVQGFALREKTPCRLFDLPVLNQFDHDVQVVAVRIKSSGDLTGAPVFKMTSHLPFGVTAGQSYWMEVQYTGATAGPLSGFVEVECNDPIEPIVRIPLAAAVVAIKHPELRFTPNSFDLGNRLVGATVWEDLTIENIGAGDAVFANIDVSPAGPFTANPNYPATSLPGGLASGGHIVIRVLCQPTARGVANATLKFDVRSSDPQYQRSYEIPLTVTSQMPTLFIAGGPQRVRGPGGDRIPVRERELKTLDFGVAAPSQNTAASFWIRNIGDAQLTVQNLVIVNQGAFSANAVFPLALKPGNEIEVPCTFLAPPVAGMNVAGEFRLLSDDPIRMDSGDPLVPGAVLKLKGRSGGPKLAEPIEFEQGVVIVTQPAPVTFILKSVGTDPVTVREVKLIDLNPGSNFSVTSVPQMSATLAPGTELTLTVTLTATQPGRYEADLVVTHNGNAHQSSQVRLRGSL